MLRRWRPWLIAAVLIASLTGVAAIGRTYFVRSRPNEAQLLWNSREAYLFVGSMRQGWHGNYFQAAGMVVSSQLRLITWPTESRPSITVFRITPDRLERYLLEDQIVGPYTVFENHIYKNSDWRWAGHRFERTSDDERRRFQSSNQPAGEWSDVNGWSRRCCLLNRAVSVTRFPLQLEGRRVEVIVRNEGPNVAIELDGVGRATERIWTLDMTPRRVRQDEYSSFLR
jgi:hypothetical protein